MTGTRTTVPLYVRPIAVGDSWQITELPFKVGGNMPGRGMGERLMIDPNDPRILYLGTEAGNGLWRSADYGVTWAEVTGFPNPGNYVQDPDDPFEYLNINQGVVRVAFAPCIHASCAALKSRIQV